MTFPFPMPPPVGNTTVLGLYLTTLTDNADSGTYTFTSVAAGPADANRKIFALVGLNASATATAVTIGGISAVKIVETISTTRSSSIWVADVPTGTTATVVVTASGTSNECILSLYQTTIASLGLLDTAANSIGSGATNTLTLSDLAVRAGGVALVFAGNTGAVQTETYNGIDAMVVDDERNSEVNHYSSCSVLTTESVDTNDFTFTTALNQAFWLAGVSYFPLTGSAYAPVLASTLSDLTTQTTYTFSSKAIGTAHADRQLVICFGWVSVGRSVVSVTVDGNAATAVTTSGTTTGLAMYRIPYPTGTTANIVITMSGACVRMGGGVYDTRPRGTVAPADFNSNNATATSITSADVEVRNGGFLISFGTQPSTETMAAAYNGVDTLVKDSQISIGATDFGLFSCVTTEYAKTNDPGFSATSSNAKRTLAAAWL